MRAFFRRPSNVLASKLGRRDRENDGDGLPSQWARTSSALFSWTITTQRPQEIAPPRFVERLVGGRSEAWRVLWHGVLAPQCPNLDLETLSLGGQFRHPLREGDLVDVAHLG